MSSARSASPTLLNLTIDTAVSNIHRIGSLNSIPDHIVVELFTKTLSAGKLTERVLRIFVATGNEYVLGCVKAFNIQPILRPILPTRCSEKF
ncbi:hypothetical protein SUGI_0547500 [Cryptomeria japonica]|uniref:uncharacterized protein LOC131069846 n=1 Tax=Cryptomeria japonica TaxID=3369 RepID=UPI002408A601|nr:uncharacterized protein LOC131069846 [Cryptomeria japonica]GLJ27888.1 hypothetical protein SUGI_0547500 [Cryptomeria japonica]